MTSKTFLKKRIDSRCFNLHPSSFISFPTRLVPRKERTLGTRLSRSIWQKLPNLSNLSKVDKVDSWRDARAKLLFCWSKPIERFHSRGQHLCKFIGTKESISIRKKFNSHRIVLVHQHGRRFIVLGQQYGRRDVMWKHSIVFLITIPETTVGRISFPVSFSLFLKWRMENGIGVSITAVLPHKVNNVLFLEIRLGGLVP